MTEEQKDNLDKMAKGKLSLLQCRAVAESILADEIFSRIEQQVKVEPEVKPACEHKNKRYESHFMFTEVYCKDCEEYLGWE